MESDFSFLVKSRICLYLPHNYLSLKLIVMKELVEKINSTMEEFFKNANAQVESGNKAAGTRARKGSLELEKLMKEFRKLSLEESKK